MLTTVAMSACSVAACLVTLQRVVGWKRIMQHSTWVDVAFTLGLGVFLGGTLGGALVAVLGGLMMAVVLTLLRWAGSITNSLTKPEDGDSEYRNGEWIYNQAPYV